MVQRDNFRNGMARLGAAVNIITTDGPAGRAGLTASAVCAVTDDPATLLLCMNRASARCAAFLGNGILCVNVLAWEHRRLSILFAGSSAEMDAHFARASWSTMETGAPVLDEACASFDCRIAQVIQMGTHNVMFCKVEAVQTNDLADPLFYFKRSYHRTENPRLGPLEAKVVPRD